MLEMLKTRKESLEQRGVKGFTLMEMLIVIAIIAVLVAIAIPVLGAQLDKAKATTDEANIRDGYASFQVLQLQGGKDGKDATFDSKKVYYLMKDGSVAANPGADAYVCQGESSKLDSADATTHEVEVAGIKVSWDPTTNKYIQYYLKDGKVVIKGVAAATAGDAPTE